MSDRAVLSIDFELFEQTPACRSAAGEPDRRGVGLEGAAFLRESLAAEGARATWFVVGTTAERHPDSVQAVATDGHEIGSHGHTHTVLTGLDAPTRRAELADSRATLRRVTGAPVDGFRAPVFGFGRDHFAELAAAGYSYDSSVLPSRAIPGWYDGEHDRHRPVPAAGIQDGAPDGLAELPVSVLPGVGLPLTGAWLRFFGPRYTVLGMRWLARRGIAPVLYVHPWEFVDLPAVDGVPRRVYVRTGDWMRRALERVLASGFEFTTARTVLEDALSWTPAGDAPGGGAARAPSGDGGG